VATKPEAFISPKILTTKLGFPAHRDQRKVFSGHFVDLRQPEIADETTNTYISGTTTDSLEIPTTNSTTTSSIKVSARDRDNDRQPEVVHCAENDMISESCVRTVKFVV